MGVRGAGSGGGRGGPSPPAGQRPQHLDGSLHGDPQRSQHGSELLEDRAGGRGQVAAEGTRQASGLTGQEGEACGRRRQGQEEGTDSVGAAPGGAGEGPESAGPEGEGRLGRRS